MTRIEKRARVRINTKIIQDTINNFKAGSNFQRFLDMKVIKLSDPYVPSDTTALRKSVFVKTQFGSGRLVYKVYGNPDGKNTWNDTTAVFQDRPIRGAFWTIRMLADGGAEKLRLIINRWFKSGRQ